jgi:diaminopropionate ammonia-lyase
MGLGSFKALGRGARDRARGRRAVQDDDLRAGADGPDVYVTASAGNHGLSVAAGARLFGARAVIYLAETVPEAFAARLQPRVPRCRARARTMRPAWRRRARPRGEGLDAAVGQFLARLHRIAPARDGRLSATGRRGRGADRPAAHAISCCRPGVGGLAAAVAAHAAMSGAMARRSSWSNPRPRLR